MVAQTIVKETNINTVQTNTYGTLLNRKFSDYTYLIFVVKYSDEDIRETRIIPSIFWKSSGQVPMTILHGAGGSTGANYDASQVTFQYVSDSSLHMWIGGKGTFKWVEIMGMKV